MGQVQQLLARRANEDHGRVAFVHGRAGTAITWGDVAAVAADWLVSFGTRADGPPPLVGVALGAPTSFCAAYLAALANHTAIAPLDPRATADELAERASILALTDVLGDHLDEVQTAAITDAGARVWVTEGLGIRLSAEGDEAWGDHGRLHTESVILATSGSTGRPKLVPLAEEQLLHVARQVAQHHGFTRDDRGYSPLPLFHINAQVVGVLATLVSGASLVVEERFSKEVFWDVAEDTGATWLNLVPAILATLAGRPGPAEATSARIRFARSASSPLSDAVRARFEARAGVRVLETYGMTEAASQITANPLVEAERRAGSVGLPVGAEVRTVVDGSAVAPGETGEVQIRGAAVVGHYLSPGRIDATPASGPDGWLRTGDLGRLDADGFLYLAGRADDVINRGGEKVYPREIEEVLLRDSRVREAVATGRPHDALGAQPVAFVVTSLPLHERDRLAAELAQSCAEALSRYKRPAEIFVTDALPVGATGKVSRRGLRELFELAATQS